MGYTDYLFPTPDVAYSSGQILDLFGCKQRYNRSASSEEADRQAVQRDWAAVGDDLRRSITRFAGTLRSR
jgi:hypothetical protein